jgi:RimJ/RimL family protein N-acetyltransferase
MRLESKRLVVREYQEHDLVDRRQLLVECFASEGDEEETRSWLEWTMNSYREFAKLYQPPFGDYCIDRVSDGRSVGSVGIVPTLVAWDLLDRKGPGGDSRVALEFGLFWAVHPDYRRQGFASEAARRVCEFLFDDVNVTRVVAVTERDNEICRGVMDRIGMTIHEAKDDRLPWLQTVGVLENPRIGN